MLLLANLILRNLVTACHMLKQTQTLVFIKLLKHVKIKLFMKVANTQIYTLWKYF